MYFIFISVDFADLLILKSEQVLCKYTDFKDSEG